MLVCSSLDDRVEMGDHRGDEGMCKSPEQIFSHPWQQYAHGKIRQCILILFIYTFADIHFKLVLLLQI